MVLHITPSVFVAMGQPSRSHRLSLTSVMGDSTTRNSDTCANRFKAALVVSTALASLALAGPFFPIRAQSVPSRSPGEGSASLRAVNMARMTAERLNGGLQVYRAAACMHQQSGGSCLIRSSSNGYVFRFYGGEPGWQQLGKTPTLETELLVAPDGRSVRSVIYNGPVRATPSSQP